MQSDQKLKQLQAWLVDKENVAVAFSGGVDSTLLLKVAADCLPHTSLVALTAISPSMPKSELQEAKQIASHLGLKHVLIDSKEIEDPNYRENSPDRCFYCKREVYALFAKYAREHGNLHLLDGTNADDVGDHRPGRRAARAHGVRSPLQELGFTKSEIRQLARELGLPNWDKPSAACLASRVPYGTPIDTAVLSQIERAEQALKRIGFGQLRVRHHGDIARLELEPVDFQRAVALRERITQELTAVGYRYVALDLAGFRSGSMNDGLDAASEESHGYRETLPIIQ
jgi:uncharacterized protein